MGNCTQLPVSYPSFDLRKSALSASSAFHSSSYNTQICPSPPTAASASAKQNTAKPPKFSPSSPAITASFASSPKAPTAPPRLAPVNSAVASTSSTSPTPSSLTTPTPT